LNFLDDLIEVGHVLLKSTDRKVTLWQCLQQMNKQLPADVYLPFKSNMVQGMKVASIAFEECRVFSTKMRAPFYVCVEVY
jgi:phosphatidylinositol 4-kinase